METEEVLVNHVCSFFIYFLSFFFGMDYPKGGQQVWTGLNKSELWYQNSNTNIHTDLFMALVEL